MYHTLTIPTLNETVIVRESDGATIPTDPNNQDYCEYLAWLTEQTADA